MKSDPVLVEGSADGVRRVAARGRGAGSASIPSRSPQLLAWIDSLRALFGDPPVDRRPTVRATTIGSDDAELASRS